MRHLIYVPTVIKMLHVMQSLVMIRTGRLLTARIHHLGAIRLPADYLAVLISFCVLIYHGAAK